MPRRRERILLEYLITFQTPFHCGTGLPVGMVDRSVQRDEKGFLYVPGSTLKGAIRERCERLARMFGLEAGSPHEPRGLAEFSPNHGLVDALFGSRARPGTLFFDDAELTEEWRDFFQPGNAPRLQTVYRQGQVQERTQVSLGRLTGTAHAGALFTSEYGIPGLTFAGRISGVVEDWSLLYQERTFALVALVSGLLAVDQLGGNRSTGSGACVITVSSLTANGTPVLPDVLLNGLDDFPYYQMVADDG